MQASNIGLDSKRITVQEAIKIVDRVSRECRKRKSKGSIGFDSVIGNYVADSQVRALNMVRTQLKYKLNEK